MHAKPVVLALERGDRLQRRRVGRRAQKADDEGRGTGRAAAIEGLVVRDGRQLGGGTDEGVDLEAERLGQMRLDPALQRRQVARASRRSHCRWR
jgi:hypothetical protein